MCMYEYLTSLVGSYLFYDILIQPTKIAVQCSVPMKHTKQKLFN